MGLRCSILGHTFDETEVRRDRRERGSGNEVVTVVAQVERCSRCGAERVVSENKEVVSVVNADEVGLEEGADEGGDPRPDSSEMGDSEAVPSDDLATGLGSDADARSAPDEEPETSTEPEPEPDPPTDPSEEDVEFITETEGSLGGSEDVADDEDVPSDAVSQGDAGGTSGGIGGMAARSGAFDGADGGSGEGADGGSTGDDAEILDEPDSGRAPGQWPDEPDGDEPWSPESFEGGETDSDPASDSDPDPDVEPVADSSFTVPEGSLRCPNCGYEVSAASSFRAGDACPECQTGYLESGDGA